MRGSGNQEQANILGNTAMPDGSLALGLEALVHALADRVAIRVLERLGNCSTASAQPRLLTVQQAAKYIGRTPEALTHMVSERRIPTVRSDRRVFIDRRDLDAWIDENKRTAT